MPRFIYRQGTEFNGEKMPAEVVMFGVEFLKNQPVNVTADMFRDPVQFQHAVNKLRTHPHFEEDKVEEATVLEVRPDKKRKPTKPVEPDPAPDPVE